MPKRKILIREIRKSFECQRCNRCCEQPGYVFLTGKDVRKMAGHFKLDPEAFLAEYGEVADGSAVLKSKESEACIFLDANGCTINDVKPQQCRDFPFKWRDPDSFDYCAGIVKIKERIKSHAPAARA